MSGIVEQLASDIANKIAQGQLISGTQLNEVAMSEKFGVSRNTLREAFRLLSSKGLVEHFPRRGVFVKRLMPDDLHDLYAYRRFVELSVLNFLPASVVGEKLLPVCAEAEHAREIGDWKTVGTANTRFHQIIVDGAGCKRLSEDMKIAMAQSRLAFTSSADWSLSHSPFVDSNRIIANCLVKGDLEKAYVLLEDYLLRAEKIIEDIIRRVM